MGNDWPISFYSTLASLARHGAQAVWRDMVFEMGKTTSEEYNPRFSKPLGGMQAFRIALTEEFPNVVSSLIKSGQLHLEQQAQPLALAAS